MITSACRMPSNGRSLSPEEKAAKEDELLEQLSDADEGRAVEAINGLVALGSRKAVPGILKIAADRKVKDNADRTFAARALGMLGDSERRARNWFI